MKEIYYVMGYEGFQYLIIKKVHNGYELFHMYNVDVGSYISQRKNLLGDFMYLQDAKDYAEEYALESGLVPEFTDWVKRVREE